MTDEALLGELAARVEARRAAGDYAGLDWLEEPVAPVAPATPVDRYLRRPRPAVRTDLLTAGGRGGPASALRERVAHWVGTALRDWDVRQADADADLRDALAWLALTARSEVAARELLEGRLDEQEEEVRAQVERALASLRSGSAAAAAELRAEMAALRASVEERLRDLERARRADRVDGARAPAPGPPPRSGAAAPAPADGDFDYLAFEDRFRGPEEVVRARQRHHLPRFAGRGRVVDLGCGRGEFLELLAGAGAGALGVDSSAEMVAEARAKGLEVEHADLLDFLAAQPPGSVDGIMCSHVIEHLPWPVQVRLVRLAAAALAPGGVLVVETPNPLSLVAGSVNFHRDPSHLRPVHPDTLAFMLEREGFGDIEVEPLSETAPQDGVPRVRAAASAELWPLVDEVNAALAHVDRLLHGAQDVAVAARWPG